MAKWGSAWGAKWSRAVPARWGDAWGVPWSETDHQEASTPQNEQSHSGGVYSGFVQPYPGRRRKPVKNPDDEINRLVIEAMEGDQPPIIGPPNTKQSEPALISRPITTDIAKALPQFLPFDDDEEALLLLLVA